MLELTFIKQALQGLLTPSRQGGRSVGHTATPALQHTLPTPATPASQDSATFNECLYIVTVKLNNKMVQKTRIKGHIGNTF